jgi:hypothetical protein
MKIRTFIAVSVLVSCAWGIGSPAQGAITQLGLVLDTSTSFDSPAEQMTAKAGLSNAVALMDIDGSVEITLVQFSAMALTKIGPLVLDSAADRQAVIDAINDIDPADTEIIAGIGGTNFDAAFKEVTTQITGSPNFADREFAIVNMITDGDPTFYDGCCTINEALDEELRKANARAAGLNSRNAATAAGIEVLSFELIDPPTGEPGGIPYVETLAFPGSAPFTAPPFPDPITSKGFIVELAGVEDIEDALLAKWVAADLGTPEPGTLILLTLGAAALLRRR